MALLILVSPGTHFHCPQALGLVSITIVNVRVCVFYITRVTFICFVLRYFYFQQQGLFIFLSLAQSCFVHGVLALLVVMLDTEESDLSSQMTSAERSPDSPYRLGVHTEPGMNVGFRVMIQLFSYVLPNSL